MKAVNTSIRKKDAMALVTGKPVYTDDLARKDALCVKLLHSPHAFAYIRSVDTARALRVPGVACVLTFADVPQTRFTIAGQSYPETSPYDRLILDRYVRFLGDAAAIVAAETEQAAEAALRLIKVDYEVLPPVLDIHKALDNPSTVHPEDDWTMRDGFGADRARNLCAAHAEEMGDVDAEFERCAHTFSATYHTYANQQTMMETFRAQTQLDPYGRLEVMSSTQVPFHVRRILARALGIPKSRVRVIKPRIGGGFGAKQTAVCEMYPAIVTMKTGRAAKIVYTRREAFFAGSPRHEMEISVRVGADAGGIIRALDVKTLSNTGAYGEHGWATVGLSGHKSIPLYGKLAAYRFDYTVVYTNSTATGAYRGFGATQGIFAVESAVNELAHRMNIDPVEIRTRNMVREGDVMPAYYGETATSCALDRCLARAAQMMDWDEKYPVRTLPDGRLHGVGVAMAMQGSGISNIDVGSATVRLTEDGAYQLQIGATDMGTGCDTILAQIAAECLDCAPDDVTTMGVDTDVSPYDTGSYASSTTFITGQAVVKACGALRARILGFAAQLLSCAPEELELEGTCVVRAGDEDQLPLREVAAQAICGNDAILEATAANTSPASPPPFMVGMAEVAVDPLTGVVELLDYVGVVDCGTTINPNLARVQTEGGLAQGIGMALYERPLRAANGRLTADSFMQYKIPSRLDISNLRVAFESSYEASGPFGAKSIGEIVINTPCPAIADAVYNATGVRVREMPITPEKIAMGMIEL